MPSSGDGSRARDWRALTRNACGSVLRCIVVGLCVVSSVAGNASDEKFFARVGADEISVATWEAYAAAAARGQFFHGQGAEQKRAQWRKQTAQTLVDETLLAQEARRRGLRSSTSDAGGQDQGSERQGWVTALKADVARTVAPADDAAVRAYFAQHADKFTTPEQLRVSVVLLTVPPYAPAAEWQQAMDRARALHRRVVAGERFDELARANSMHESAARGGDLGLVHRGVLSRELQEIADTLQVGGVAEPRMILRGVVMVRLDEKQPAQPLSFDRAGERAAKLLEQERHDQVWRDVLARLRATTPVEINDSVL